MPVSSLLLYLAVGLAAILEGFISLHRPGIGMALLTVGTAATAWMILRRLERRAPPWTAWLWLPAFAFSLALYIYDGQVLHALAPALCVVTLGMALFWSFTGNAPFDAFSRFIPGSLMLAGLLSPFEGVVGFQGIVAEGRAGRVWGRIFLGIVVAVPLLAVFGVLMCMSDDIFYQHVSNATRGFTEDGVMSAVRLAAYVLIIFGFLRHLAIRGINAPVSGGSFWQADPLVLGVALGLVNLLFGAFLLVQARYLFGGEAMIALPGVTYAEYARKGFFELATITCFVFAVVGAVYRLSCEREDGGWPLALSSLLIVETYGVAGSALKRMAMYTDAYGLSVLRFYAAAGMCVMCGLLGIVLIATLLRRPYAWVGSRVALAALLCLGGISLMNVDGMVARSAVERAMAGKPLDMDYLEGLSADAVPELMPLLDASAEPLRHQAAIGLARMEKRLSATRDDWRSFNLGRTRALKMLDYAVEGGKIDWPPEDPRSKLQRESEVLDQRARQASTGR